LARVLLHVLEAAVPVDPRANRAEGYRRIDHVQHGAILALDDLGDARVAENARVERLPSRGRIERGAIQEHGPTRPCLSCAHLLHDVRLELAEVTVRVIQARRHGGICRHYL
jgi:hypothetical protein